MFTKPSIPRVANHTRRLQGREWRGNSLRKEAIGSSYRAGSGLTPLGRAEEAMPTYVYLRAHENILIS